MRNLLFSKMLWIAFLSILTFSSLNISYAQKESESSIRMARMMAEQIDEIWDQGPEDGMANIRIQMLKDGEPYSGKVSIFTEFSFRAESRSTYSQGFNPNKNGRWIYEELPPGTYNLVIEGFEKFEGWTWAKESVTVNSGDTPLFEINID